MRTAGGNRAFLGRVPRQLELSPEAVELLDEASNRLGVLEGSGKRLGMCRKVVLEP